MRDTAWPGKAGCGELRLGAARQVWHGVSRLGGTWLGPVRQAWLVMAGFGSARHVVKWLRMARSGLAGAARYRVSWYGAVGSGPARRSSVLHGVAWQARLGRARKGTVRQGGVRRVTDRPGSSRQGNVRNTSTGGWDVLALPVLYHT